MTRRHKKKTIKAADRILDDNLVVTSLCFWGIHIQSLLHSFTLWQKPVWTAAEILISIYFTRQVISLIFNQK